MADENPGAGETVEPFCRAPRRKCYQYAECYSEKQCMHAPSDEELEAGEMSHCLGGPGFASACEKIAADVGVPSNVLFPDGGGHGGLNSDMPGPFTPEYLRENGHRLCKSDYHVGPVTVSGKTLRCFRCGTLWNVA